MMKANEGFEVWVKEHIEDTLEEIDERGIHIDVYGDELANVLCEYEEEKACAFDTYSAAIHFIWEYRDESGAALDWVIENDLCYPMVNPFTAPCYFTYWLLLWGVKKMLKECPWCIRCEQKEGTLDASAIAEINAYIQDNHIEF